MSKTLTIFLTLAASLLLNVNTAADIYSALNKCVDIKESNERLSCFDLVSKNYRQSIKAIDTSNQEQRVDNTLTQQPMTQTQTQTQAQVENLSDENLFGNMTKKLNIDSIESNLVGQFSSWKKGMMLHLQNGQVWKVTKRSGGYKRLTNPKVTITNGFFGSYNAKVEGLNSMAKVKRIK